MNKIIELRTKRAAAVKSARDLVSKVEGEKRSMTAEDTAQFDRIMAEVETLRQEIEREEKVAALEVELAATAGLRAAGKTPPEETLPLEEGETPEKKRAKEVSAAFRSYLCRGFSGLGQEESRTLQATIDPQGGYVVAPQHFVRELIQAVDDMVFIRRAATKHTVERAETLGVPSLDTDLLDADWTAELATGALDTALRIGKRELAPVPLAKRVRMSNRLLRQATIDVEALVRSRLAYRFAVTEERAFLTGNGTNQPLGLFTASAQGISTGRDTVAGTATDLTFDGLIRCKYALKQQYHNRAAWLMHRSGVERIAILKDAQGQYLWRESVRAGEPDRLLGFPVHTSEFVPATFTTGQYVAMLGDFSFYWIVDALNTQVQRLTELYAESNEVGFIARRELDGMPVLEEAFVRGRLA